MASLLPDRLDEWVKYYSNLLEKLRSYILDTFNRTIKIVKENKSSYEDNEKYLFPLFNREPTSINKRITQFDKKDNCYAITKTQKQLYIHEYNPRQIHINISTKFPNNKKNY